MYTADAAKRRITMRRSGESVDSVSNAGGSVPAAVFGGGRAKGTLKILRELLNHGGLVAVVRSRGLPTLLQSALQVQALRFESSATTER